MIVDMSRPRPPFLQRETSRGKSFWYVRRGRGKRIRIRAEYGTDEFWEFYKDALSGITTGEIKRGAKSGTLQWLIDRYRETTAWHGLSQATRRQRENIFLQVVKSAGGEPIHAITKSVIVAGRDRRSKTPAQARNFLDTMRGLFAWAEESGHVKNNPAMGIKNPPRPNNGGFPVWTEDDIQKYQARWPIGTKERVWLDVLLYTGLRRGDAVKFGRQHVRDGIICINTEKTGTRVEIPMLSVLKKTLDAGPCADMAFICGASRKPLVKEAFGTMFRLACREAGILKSAHGIRKAAATRAANEGATVAELEALFAWSGGGMASLYTRSADRAKLARNAAKKMSGGNGE